MPMSSSLRLKSCLALTSMFACVQSSTDESANELTGQACPVSGTKVDHSLAITDAGVLANFGFARTMKQVLKSSGATSGTATQLYQQWMATFGTTDCSNA